MIKLMEGRIAMKTVLAMVAALAGGLLLATTARAQETGGWDSWPADQARQAAPAPQSAPAAPQAAPPAAEPVVPAPPSPPVAAAVTVAPRLAAPAPPQSAAGRWTYTEPYGWVWVPSGAAAYAVGNEPYAYLYTPVYGWTWYASPWGWGPYVAGVPFAHVWHAGPRLWYGGRWAAPRFAGRGLGHFGGFHGGFHGFHGGGHGRR